MQPLFWSVVIFQHSFEFFLLRRQFIAGKHNLQLIFNCSPVIKERTDPGYVHCGAGAMAGKKKPRRRGSYIPCSSLQASEADENSYASGLFAEAPAD
jgi:hypothetical protein